MLFTFDLYQTLALSVVAVRLGEYARKKVPLFERFCIPAPVIGGLLFAIVSCVLYVTGVLELSFDETMREVCMVFFFTSIGFQVDLNTLKAGGRSLGVYVAGIALLIAAQNVIAVAMAKVLQVSPLVGMCTGSISMAGGHGTSGAFGPILEGMGLEGASTFCTAAATYGLIAGSLIGGPVGNELIVRKSLLKTASHVSEAQLARGGDTVRGRLATYAPAAYQLIIAVGVGTVVSWLLSCMGLTFPIYIGAMIVAAVMRNVSEFTGRFPIHSEEINDMGSVFLNLFLGIAMITLKLWQLAELALPLIALLAVQTVFMALFARFVLFNMMGRDYDAAVISAGTCGFGLGATPNAMANMQTICDKYAPSVKAFLIVPIVGAFILDFINSLIITLFINII